LPADLPPVFVDANLIVQVFVNLLDNVVKYTPPATPVVISAAVRDDSVAVTCDDAGPGLPSGESSRLFEKFQRGNDEGATVGAGLGLAICRVIIRAHGGDITAAARPGGGARFVFTLPLKESGA
jgi:two-component system, OmpR family, sensor histidine kinase KdpD